MKLWHEDCRITVQDYGLFHERGYPMTVSLTPAEQPNIQTQLLELLTDIVIFVDRATEEQQKRILSALEDLRDRERRRNPRKACSVRVTVTTPDLFSSDTVRDISTGGAFVETPVSLSPGEEITLWFSLPDRKEPVLVTGQVVWTPRKGIGVKFVSPLGKDLEEMIESL
jgi:Tfp pilus assembly protein PilZ